MTVPAYITHPDYAAFLAKLRADPADESTRLVFADWIQDQGDEAEAVALRERRSVPIDILPALTAFAQSVKSAVADAYRPMADLMGSVAEQFQTAAQELGEALNTTAGRELIASMNRLNAPKVPRTRKKPARKKPTKRKGKK